MGRAGQSLDLRVKPQMHWRKKRTHFAGFTVDLVVLRGGDSRLEGSAKVGAPGRRRM